MSMVFSEKFFEELAAKLAGAGLPDHQVLYYLEQYRAYQNFNCADYEIFKDHQMPSDDCFRTLAEAQKIFASNTDRSEYSMELSSISRYLETPYNNVAAAKKAMAERFGCNDADIEMAYNQDPEWLLITADVVNKYADFLKDRFSDRKLRWSIYMKAALLGLEKTKCRINSVLELLGADIGERVIKNDLQNGAWLFYLWFTDPVGCVEYMLECGMTPEQVLKLLESEPDFLFEYKEDRKLKYHHNQTYIDLVIRKYKY